MTKTKKSQFSAQRIAYDALLAALCAVLGYYAIDLGNNKITLESLPVLIGALLFGPVDAMLIALVGNLISQVLHYGFSATTILWILPHVLQGLFVGLYVKKKNFKLGTVEAIVVVVISELVTTILNTGVIYLDAKIYGYYSPAYVFGSLVVRLVTSAVKGVVYGVVLPPLVKAIRRTGIRKEQKRP